MRVLDVVVDECLEEEYGEYITTGYSGGFRDTP